MLGLLGLLGCWVERGFIGLFYRVFGEPLERTSPQDSEDRNFLRTSRRGATFESRRQVRGVRALRQVDSDDPSEALEEKSQDMCNCP